MNRTVRRFRGSQVKDVMDAQGRRYDWLAMQLEVPTYTVTRWLNDTSPIIEPQAQKLSNILGVPFILLFESHEWSEKLPRIERLKEASVG